ncbi:hypothetical protein ANO11243_091220 [Dothideomycetidae sp. 11243]|nr:hypothetical protein ANO11243_091220 [fungal sp. No.11243]
MVSPSYSFVPLKEADQDDDDSYPLAKPKSHQFRSCSTLYLVFGLISVALNGFLLMRRPWPSQQQFDSASKYAGLYRDQITESFADTAHASTNRTIQDAAWAIEDMQPWRGVIALSADYIASHGLHDSWQWPWDSSKRMYMLAASHEIHCAGVLRVALNENFDGIPQEAQRWQYAHVMHCLNVLRDAIMCNADDTPLEFAHLHHDGSTGHLAPGANSKKQCRDWHRLIVWADEHSACYQSPDRSSEDHGEAKHYMHCPDGSRPWLIDSRSEPTT